MIIIICVIGGYVDKFYGYNLVRPTRCGTFEIKMDLPSKIIEDKI